MDISLLSQLIKELIPVKGSLTLPRIGVFRTEDVPAFFSENGRVINPPSKKITFSSEYDQSDTALIEEYAAKIGAGADELKEQSETFFSGLLAEKYRTGAIRFPGFGKLVFADDGSADFIIEGNQDPFTGRYGLEPLNLKKIDIPGSEEEYVVLPDTFGHHPDSHQETETAADHMQETDPETAPAQAPEPSPAEAATPAQMPEPSTAQEIPAVQAPSPKAAVPAESDKKTHRGWIITISILLGVLIMAAVVIFIGRSGSLDSLLYSEEELQLIESAGSGK